MYVCKYACMYVCIYVCMYVVHSTSKLEEHAWVVIWKYRWSLFLEYIRKHNTTLQTMVDNISVCSFITLVVYIYTYAVRPCSCIISSS